MDIFNGTDIVKYVEQYVKKGEPGTYPVLLDQTTVQNTTGWFNGEFVHTRDTITNASLILIKSGQGDTKYGYCEYNERGGIQSLTVSPDRPIGTIITTYPMNGCSLLARRHPNGESLILLHDRDSNIDKRGGKVSRRPDINRVNWTTWVSPDDYWRDLINEEDNLLNDPTFNEILEYATNNNLVAPPMPYVAANVFAVKLDTYLWVLYKHLYGLVSLFDNNNGNLVSRHYWPMKNFGKSNGLLAYKNMSDLPFDVMK